MSENKRMGKESECVYPVDSKIAAQYWSAAVVPILESGHVLRIPLSGRSMYPLITGGRDEVILSSVKGRKLKRSDIVLFARSDGTHVLHRIHHVKDDGYYMLGDAQTFIEGPVRRDQILAVAETVIRKNKAVSCKSAAFRIFSAIWLFIRPFRPLMIYAARNINISGRPALDKKCGQKP